MVIERPNQVWAMDLTYIPMARGFVYVLDCRRVLAWLWVISQCTKFVVA
jgi:putative transposase